MSSPLSSNVNPYQSPRATANGSLSLGSAQRPRRTPAVWATTVIMLLACFLAAGAASYVILLWVGAQVPGGSRWLPEGSNPAALGVGAFNLLLMAGAIAFGQVRASFYFDSIWARTIAWLLLIEAGVLFCGAFLLDVEWHLAASWLAWPALVSLAMGICMYDWCNRLFAAKMERRKRLLETGA